MRMRLGTGWLGKEMSKNRTARSMPNGSIGRIDSSIVIFASGPQPRGAFQDDKEWFGIQVELSANLWHPAIF